MSILTQSSPASKANPLLALMQEVSLRFLKVCGDDTVFRKSSLEESARGSLCYRHPCRNRIPRSLGSLRHTSVLLFHLTPSLVNQLSQHQLTLINPIFRKLDKQTQKFTEQSELLETRLKHLFWLLSLLRC